MTTGPTKHEVTTILLTCNECEHFLFGGVSANGFRVDGCRHPEVATARLKDGGLYMWIRNNGSGFCAMPYWCPVYPEFCARERSAYGEQTPPAP